MAMNGLKSNLMMIFVALLVLIALIYAKRELNKAIEENTTSSSQNSATAIE